MRNVHGRLRPIQGNDCVHRMHIAPSASRGSVCRKCNRTGTRAAPHDHDMAMHSAHATHAEEGPLSAYLNRIDQYRLLTPDEERELARRWKRSGDPQAARGLTLGNLRFVVKIAFEYRTY